MAKLEFDFIIHSVNELAPICCGPVICIQITLNSDEFIPLFRFCDEHWTAELIVTREYVKSFQWNVVVDSKWEGEHMEIAIIAAVKIENRTTTNENSVITFLWLCLVSIGDKNDGDYLDTVNSRRARTVQWQQVTDCAYYSVSVWCKLRLSLKRI